MLFNIVVKLPLPLPVSYRLALSGLETAICGPPPLLPYLQLVCGTVNVPQLPAAVVPSVVVNTGLFGASVFDPTLTGCLVNCTLVDAPTQVYFGPHLPPPGPLIIAPKFELLAPPTPKSAPFCPPWDRPFMFSDLLTLRNLVYLGIALVFVYTLWRSASGLLALKRRLVTLVADIVVSFHAQPTPTPQAPIATYGLSRFEDFSVHIPSLASLGSLSDNDLSNDFSNPFEGGTPAQWVDFAFPPTQIEEEVATDAPAVEVSTDEDSASAASSDDDESAAVDEEPLPLPATPSPSVPVVSDDETQAEVVDSSAVVDDALVERHLTQDAAISDGVAAEADTKLAPPSLSAPVVTPDGMLVVDFEHSSALLEQEKFPQWSASPAEETGAVVGSVVDVPIAPQAVVPTVDAAASSSVATATGDEQPVKPKRPTRSGRKCKALRRQREREAEAAAAAANPEAPQLEAVAEEPVNVEPDVVEEPLTRDERRRQRKLRARAQEAEGPVFTDADFPPLPVTTVAPKPLEHRMSYALVTAVSRPSATAVIHTHGPPSPTLPVEVDAHPEPEPPRFKWIAASRQYEDLPQDSVWTNWTMDLEDMATFRYAKKTRRKKKD
ncbi:hypothetical protein BC629DRAFT_1560505 [Irpex lacteus]|nr:hypothetical protein BC629DRAFT_1560505 [Irpex lacteus]